MALAPVNLMIKPASGLCNMKCDYCFYCDEAGKRSVSSYGRMSERTLKNVIRKTVLAAEDSCLIVFQGGEPTLCGLDFFRKVPEYVRQYNKRGVRVEYALQTNGYGITEEWCRYLKENHFLAGLSVDGTENIHDAYRHSRSGQPTYRRVLQTAEMFDRFGIDYNILTVVHRQTAENIREIYEAYRRRGWHYLQFIACLDPLDEERGQCEYSLLPETYGRFLIDLFELWFADLKRGRQPYIRQFENYMMMLLGYPPESCEQRGVCGIQNVVEADGSVYPCDFYVLDDYCLGNFNHMSFQEICQNGRRSSFISRSLNHPEACGACRWFSLCRGGCFRCRLAPGDDGRAWNYFCPGYQMFFERCFDRLKEAAEIRAGRS